MIYSVTCEYAIRALTRLACRAGPGQYLLLRELLDGTDLPGHFVGKILQSLVKAGLLDSSKGRGGGFALIKPPEKIALRQIVEVVDGPQRTGRCILGLASCDKDQPCPQHEQWLPIREQIDRLLDDTTLADLAAALQHKEARAARQARRR